MVILEWSGSEERSQIKSRMFLGQCAYREEYEGLYGEKNKIKNEARSWNVAINTH